MGKIRIKDILKKEFILEMLNKYKEIILYLIFGVLTTVVNFIVYIIFAWLISFNETISNTIAWFISVLFAYITNKIWVFKVKNKRTRTICYEIISFFGCRAVSGALDIGLFYIMVERIGINDVLTKCIIAILVIVLNYVTSKLITFKTNKEEVNEY